MRASLLFATSMRLYFAKGGVQHRRGQLVLIAVQMGMYRGLRLGKWQRRSNR